MRLYGGDGEAACGQRRRTCRRQYGASLVDEVPDHPVHMTRVPKVNTNALNWATNADKARTSANDSAGKGSRLLRGVGLHRYFSNHNKPRRTLISRVIKGSRAMPSRSGSPRMADSRGPVRENSSQSQTRLSASNRVALLAGYAEGVPVQELATRFNIHRATVREIARRAGHPSRASEHSQQLRGEAARLYAEGFTLSQVAAQLGIGDEAVRSAVVANGGTIRPKGRRKMSAYF